MQPINILAFAGSLRKQSYNKSAILAAKELAPEGVSVTIFDLTGIPLYSGDVEAQGMPERVQEFRDAIKAADAVLIATPEYNHFISGVLKNALDWASRTVEDVKPLQSKPVAIMGATPGGLGTARAQLQLRALLSVLRMQLLVEPEVYISKAHEVFDAEGKLQDERTKDAIKALLQGLKEWTLRVQS